MKNCMSHLNGEDFLVIGGDCVCDLDLSELLRFHRERGGEATLALCHHAAPLEYGLVVVDPSGRVERFVEKPSWGQVVTDLVNTGIYVLSPAAMERVLEHSAYDFGKELFPTMLQEGAPLYGCPLSGYWCDMGDCGAYLNCVCDALSGKVKLDIGLPQRGPGIWSGAPRGAGARGVGGAENHGAALGAAGAGLCRAPGHPVRSNFVPRRSGPQGRGPQ